MKTFLLATALVLLPPAAFADDGGAEAATDAGPTCVDGVLTSGDKTISCAPYGCGDGDCKSTCASTSDCAPGFVCESGKCITTTVAICSSDNTASISPDGRSTDCRPYSCFDGLCHAGCVRDSDCSGKNKCN